VRQKPAFEARNTSIFKDFFQLSAPPLSALGLDVQHLAAMLAVDGVGVVTGQPAQMEFNFNVGAAPAASPSSAHSYTAQFNTGNVGAGSPVASPNVVINLDGPPVQLPGSIGVDTPPSLADNQMRLTSPIIVDPGGSAAGTVQTPSPRRPGPATGSAAVDMNTRVVPPGYSALGISGAERIVPNSSLPLDPTPNVIIGGQTVNLPAGTGGDMPASQVAQVNQMAEGHLHHE